jgi:hypothetical protein
MLFKGTGLGDRRSGCVHPGPRIWIFFLPVSRIRGSKSTGSRIRIRNTDDNDHISSKEHLKKSKTRRGTYLLLELFIFAQIFAFYLVTQSLWPSRQPSGDQRA